MPQYLPQILQVVGIGLTIYGGIITIADFIKLALGHGINFVVNFCLLWLGVALIAASFWG
jgi:hypothetical protein